MWRYEFCNLLKSYNLAEYFLKQGSFEKLQSGKVFSEARIFWKIAILQSIIWRKKSSRNMLACWTQLILRVVGKLTQNWLKLVFAIEHKVPFLQNLLLFPSHSWFSCPSATVLEYYMVVANSYNKKFYFLKLCFLDIGVLIGLVFFCKIFS